MVLLTESDSSRAPRGTFDISPWLEEGENCLVESIRYKFVTGKWDKSAGEEQEEEEAFGELEDLDTGEKFGDGQF